MEINIQKSKIEKIPRLEYLKSSKTARIRLDDFENRNDVDFYSINGTFYLWSISGLGGFAPYLVEILDILFIVDYSSVYGLSLNSSKIRFAMDLEFALIGVENYNDQFYIITEGTITGILCATYPEMCYISHHGKTLNEGGFVTDYKRIDTKTLKLIHENGSIAEYSLFDSSYTYPSFL